MDIKQVILRSVYGKLSDGERDELEHWLREEKNRRLYEKIRLYLEERDAVDFLAGIDTEAALRRTRRRLRRPVLNLTTAVAGIAAAILIGIMWWPVSRPVPIAPEAGSCPVITLASGEVLRLDGSVVEHRSDDADIRVSGENIEVRGGKVSSKVPVYNTLTVPRGESYSITLADGSRVWINALSSLKFPSSFEGCAERKVELTGEGYFEVARNTSCPFRVVTAGQTVVVTGTVFNVSAYTGEVSQTTLCSGSVTVEMSRGEKIPLDPGQQLSVDLTGEVTVAEVNPDIYTAWRTGEYYFDNQTLGEVFQALGRWFDIQAVDFADPEMKNLVFSGKLRKADGLETILQVIGRAIQRPIGYQQGKIGIGMK